jgi:hypothetical protein
LSFKFLLSPVFPLYPFTVHRSPFFPFQPRLQVGEGIVGCHRPSCARASSSDGFIRHARMFVLVAIDAKQFPVAAIERIVVVIVIFMVHCQFAQAHTGKFTTAATADVWIDFQRPVAIRCFALAAVPARFGYDAVEPRLIGDGRFGHGWLIAGVTGRNKSTVPVAHYPAGTVRL